jgi:5-(carboxyamino)imidazole ribonucleotide synthase
MMALDGMAMGIEFSFIVAPGEDSRCVDYLGHVVAAEPDLSVHDLFVRLGYPDVVTTEKEGVDVAFYQQFAEHCSVFPPAKAVWLSQNRLREKNFLNAQGVPTTAYKPATSLQEIVDAATTLGYPVIVKTQENGYDGKGQWRLNSGRDINKMIGAENSGPWLLEKVVTFEREVSIIAARSVSGEIKVYPLVENVHRDGVLLTSRAPVEDISVDAAAVITGQMAHLMDKLDYVGVLSMECFVTATGILANELAPRVHNSGHWTQNGLSVGQFEQHVRAILDLPLAEPTLIGAAGMLNLLGVAVNPQNVLKPNHHFHWYSKEVRPGRKVGHINVTADNIAALKSVLSQLEKEIYG